MKVLTVVHNFPPRHHAGAELYAYHLARALSPKHQQTIFTVDHSLFRKNYSRREYEVGGLRTIEVSNHRHYRRFEDSYADPRMAAHFRRILRDEDPDIVHFQHLLHHSFTYPLIAREMGVPSVMTLHEYWLLCGRNGQMIQSDDSRCDRPGLAACAKCMSRFTWGRRGLDVWVLRGIQALKSVTGVDLKAQARRVRFAQNGDPAEVPPDVLDEMRRLLLVREARVRDLVTNVDYFIAPSAFLRDRFVDFGVAEAQILVSDYGTPLERFQKRATTDGTTRSDKLRIGFLGSVQSVKGVHVLLAALDRLPPGRFEARIYGDLASKPEYSSELSGRAREDVFFIGRIAFELVPKALSLIDVLVVPSIWWENSPLVIHEAFAAGVPVVASDIGGMAELVEHEKSGLLFRAGDAGDLAAKLRSLIDDPQKIHRLRRGLPALKSIQEDAEFHDELYQTVVGAWT